MEPAGAGGGRRVAWIGLRVGLLVAALLVWWQWDALSRFMSGRGAPSVAEPLVEAELGPAPAASPSALELAEQRWTSLLGVPPAWPGDLAQPTDCPAVEADLSRICRALAEQDPEDPEGPIAALGDPCASIRAIAEDLAARPPDVRSELLSHAQMLDNVFHLFRTLGRERVTSLRRLLWEEQELAEPAGLALLRWLASRDACAASGTSALTLDVLYDYSAYLLTTMGGQAYLRRRTPRIEGLVSLYALVIIDRSQREGHDPAGIDVRPEIERTRALLADQPLVFREQYLALLDGMAERRKERAGPS